MCVVNPFDLGEERGPTFLQVSELRYRTCLSRLPEWDPIEVGLKLRVSWSLEEVEVDILFILIVIDGGESFGPNRVKRYMQCGKPKINCPTFGRQN